MKKIILSIGIVLILVLFGGCKKTDTGTDTNEISPEPTNTASVETTITPTVTPDPTPTETVSALTVADYYPILNNVQYVYLGEGNEYASYTVITDYSTKDRVQLRTNNGGSELVEVLEIKDARLTKLFSKGECYYRENLIEKNYENTADSEILLQEPLVKGTEWVISNNRKRYISNVNVDITTPVGTFKALEVTTESTDENSDEGITIDYYAYKVGLVKTIYQSDDMEVTSTLDKIEDNTPFTQTIMFYYPDVNEEKIYPVEKQIDFYTNDVTRVKLEEAIKDITQDKFEPVLTANAKINSLYLNKDNIVYVDFTKELVDDMNAGAGYEAQILQCITNTLGNYYGVNQVYITLDGKPYESGHILLKKGETLKVNMEGVVTQIQ